MTDHNESMRERIARVLLAALAERREREYGPPDGPLVTPRAEQWDAGDDVLVDGEFDPLHVADAVLTAIEEPTEGMLDAAERAYTEGDPIPTKFANMINGLSPTPATEEMR